VNADLVAAHASLLLDTTVYIDGAKTAWLPADIAALLSRHVVYHSSLSVAAWAFGHASLNPLHPGTIGNRRPIAVRLDAINPARIAGRYGLVRHSVGGGPDARQRQSVRHRSVATGGWGGAGDPVHSLMQDISW
jgi:hypothetical protein